MVVVGVLVIDVLWQVFTRYVLKDPSKWTEELAIFLLVWVALAWSGCGNGPGAHLGIDYFVQRSSRQSAGAEIFAFLCIVLFAIFVMIGGGQAGADDPAFAAEIGGAGWRWGMYIWRCLSAASLCFCTVPLGFTNGFEHF